MGYLRTISNRSYFIIMVSYVVPLFFTSPVQEVLWFTYLVPSFICSYYCGLRGGILAAFVSITVHLIVEHKEYLNGDRLFWENYWDSMFLIIIFFVSFGAGLLAEQLKRKQRELEEMALRDPLTKLYNRRYLYKRLEEEVSKYERSREPFSILMIDVDDFKHYNDSFGHLAGDDVLVSLAGIMTKETRPYDAVCRWGGEEFVILYPDTDRAEVLIAAERLRESVIAYGFGHRQVTISIGVVINNDSVLSVNELLNKADKALYQAKQEKNRTFVYAYS